jgi:L-threonine-O-3-phosphate decarboxylase
VKGLRTPEHGGLPQSFLQECEGNGISPGEAHGGVRLSELRLWGLGPADVIDFSASVTPYGPSPMVREALRRAPLDRYPDIDSTELCESLSAHLGVPMEWIVPGNGATELIHAAARVWAGHGKAIGHSPPTFGEYAAAARAVGAPMITVDPASRDSRGSIGCALLYICNPNNPTGEVLSLESLARILQMMHPHIVVLDEAYIQFVGGRPTALPLLERFPNLLIVRSMTKDYGLTALRLGYAVGHPELVSPLRQQLPPWSVNGLAQAAGVAALRDTAYLDVTLERVRRAKTQLVRALQRQGWSVLAGEANFVLVKVESARETRAALLRQGLLVRDCSSFGMPEFIRVAVRRPGENRRLLAALANLRLDAIAGPGNQVE